MRLYQRLGWILFAWVLFPAVLGVIKGLNHLLFGGLSYTKTMDLFFDRMFFNGVFPVFYLGLMFVITAAILFFTSSGYSDKDSRVSIGVAIALVLASIGPFYHTVDYTVWENGKDKGRYYANSTVVYVKDPAKVPDSLGRLVDGASTTDECARLGAHDVKGCVKQGTLSEEGWDPRVSSFKAAQLVLTKKSGEMQRSTLQQDTVTYLNARPGQPAAWSGIIDGTGKEQPMVGIAEWSGVGQPKVCKFEGQYAMKRAWGGERRNSMGNYIAEKFPQFKLSLRDVWGYCDGDEPIVVVPVTKQVHWMDRTVDTAAGIITIRGNSGEEAKFEHFASVEPGSYPGPVYPMSLVEVQRDQAKWIAGRKNADRFGFGYDPGSSPDQQGNVSEYLLRDKATGRLVYVTPLTLRSSGANVFVAYAITYADEVRSGSLNELSLYVLEDGDPRRNVNIDTLAADAKTWMSDSAGNFVPNGGVLIEYTPINGTTWRAFGEMNGVVVYQLDITAWGMSPAKLVKVDPNYGVADPAQDGGSKCKEDLGALSDGDLATCNENISKEVSRRLNGG